MYKIYKEGKEIGTTEKLVYIKKHPTNGCYTIAGESDGEGIALNGASYALPGKDLGGLERVVITETDGGAAIDEMKFEVNPESDINYGLPLETVRSRAVKKTKAMIEKRLRGGIEYGGKVYNACKEKQDLLSSQLGLYLANAQAGESDTLSWNTKDGVCEEWEYDELRKLANSMKAAAKPLQKKQQEAEIRIREAETNEAIEAILRDFE